MARSVKPPRYEQYLFPARGDIRSITTELVYHDDKRVVVKASIAFGEDYMIMEAHGEADMTSDENPVSQAETRAKKRVLLDYLGEQAPVRGDYDDDEPRSARPAGKNQDGPSQAAPSPGGPTMCDDCGREVTGYGRYSTEQILKWRIRDYGVPLCGSCAKRRRASEQAISEPDIPF